MVVGIRSIYEVINLWGRLVACAIRFLVYGIVLILYPLEVRLYAWKMSIPHFSFYIMFIKARLGMKSILRRLESPIIATPCLHEERWFWASWDSAVKISIE